MQGKTKKGCFIMHRIKKLRMMALENTICFDEFFYKFYKCYTASQKTSKEDRYAEAFFLHSQI